LKLEYVGVFTHLRFCHIEPREALLEFLRNLQLAVSASLACSTVEGFVAAMERIYPLFGLDTTEPLPTTLAEYTTSNPSFASTLNALLREFKTLRDDVSRILHTKPIITLMQLLTPCIGGVSRLSRLSLAAAHHVKCYKQAVAIVQCSLCSQSFPFRLQLIDTPIQTPEVYRIPGLQYAQTSKNGVGIIVSGGKIVGRMVSGAPACDCKVLKDLDLV
jgi:hypothetical protein